MTRQILLSFPLDMQICLAGEALSEIKVFVDLVPVTVGDGALGKWIQC